MFNTKVEPGDFVKIWDTNFGFNCCGKPWRNYFSKEYEYEGKTFFKVVKWKNNNSIIVEVDPEKNYDDLKIIRGWKVEFYTTTYPELQDNHLYWIATKWELVKKSSINILDNE